MEVEGGAKFGWLAMLVKVPSIRIFNRSVTVNDLNRPAATVASPGPRKMPTPEVPNLPEPVGTGANAVISYQRSGVGFGRFPSPIRSGRETRRLVGSELDWSL